MEKKGQLGAVIDEIGDGVDDSSRKVSGIESYSWSGSFGLQKRVRSTRIEFARFVHEKTGLDNNEASGLR